ncbi:MAG: hypothetical protein PHO90_01745 [Candidatus Pacebacteria bacterium]|nr:hypothetical protein [Candidatus Paceibacterota bacterium]
MTPPDKFTSGFPSVNAEEVVGLKKDFDGLKNDFNAFNKNFTEFKKDYKAIDEDFAEFKERSKKDIEHVNQLMIGVVFFTAISFIVAIFLICSDNILSSKSDKELYLKYNEIFKSYSDQNFELKDKIYEQEIKINNLSTELEMLRTKNPSLK